MALNKQKAFEDRPRGFSLAGAFDLNEDLDAGFDTAVRNGQTTLALQYLAVIHERDRKELAELKEQVAGLTKKPAETAKKKSSSAKEDVTT